jgi:hypothetical protein
MEAAMTSRVPKKLPPFVQRAQALDALERENARPEERARLERLQSRAVERLRDRIAAGRFNPWGLQRAFARCADGGQAYDALDALFSQLFIPQVPEEPHVILDPGLVPYQPTPARAVLQLLERLRLGQDDVVYDLGSGLGLVVQALALLSPARAVGLELEPSYLASSERSAQALHLYRARFQTSDLRIASLSGATAYYLYTPMKGKALEELFARLQGVAHGRSVRVATYGPCTREAHRQAWLLLSAGDPGREDEAVVWKSR